MASVMKIEIDLASEQAFMATPLKVERNGVPLMMGSALVALDIDPWSLAGELAILSRRNAVKRLKVLLGKVHEAIPEAETIARQVIAALPQPSVEGADALTLMRLVARDAEFVDTVVCVLALMALEMLLLVSIISASLFPAVASYGLFALTWTGLSIRRETILRTLFAITAGINSLVFGSLFEILNFAT